MTDTTAIRAIIFDFGGVISRDLNTVPFEVLNPSESYDRARRSAGL